MEGFSLTLLLNQAFYIFIHLSRYISKQRFTEVTGAQICVFLATEDFLHFFTATEARYISINTELETSLIYNDSQYNIFQERLPFSYPN